MFTSNRIIKHPLLNSGTLFSRYGFDDAAGLRVLWSLGRKHLQHQLQDEVHAKVGPGSQRRRQLQLFWRRGWDVQVEAQRGQPTTVSPATTTTTATTAATTIAATTAAKHRNAYSREDEQIQSRDSNRGSLVQFRTQLLPGSSSGIWIRSHISQWQWQHLCWGIAAGTRTLRTQQLRWRRTDYQKWWR